MVEMQISSCCGFLSLKTGTIIIGTLSEIGCVSCVILLSYILSELPMLDPNHFGDYTLGPSGLKALSMALLFATFVAIVAAALIIVGARKGIPGYLRPWLALNFTGIVGALCASISLTLVALMVLPVQAFFIIFSVEVAVCGLQIYLWLIVYSYYKELTAKCFGQQTSSPMDRVNSTIIMTVPLLNN